MSVPCSTVEMTDSKGMEAPAARREIGDGDEQWLKVVSLNMAVPESHVERGVQSISSYPADRRD